MYCLFFFFKQKTAYEMRISDWSSDVCSSDLHAPFHQSLRDGGSRKARRGNGAGCGGCPSHELTTLHRDPPRNGCRVQLRRSTGKASPVRAAPAATPATIGDRKSVV